MHGNVWKNDEWSVGHFDTWINYEKPSEKLYIIQVGEIYRQNRSEKQGLIHELCKFPGYLG